ncbi:STN domain-containing protein [Rhodopseudomonas sp. P2A-2r]|uniref:STN domain-containing protein n=1 Tax=Rhodopseudomonas sp. P2A-2r TaxID=2991972 RepID=UPI0022347F2B|nr:STN domain-containing protein [Rhodopseudomonas sp. P2A-2r]UZE50495.1 STN domain-containing protein [Rhodopseudomonas sp. P2A-2r]
MFGALLMGLVGVSEAAERAGDARVAFSIPAQPLISAISRYGDATGSEALYDASLATGRFSNNVHGMMTPAEGLERLLIGTGLSARFVSERRFVVTISPAGPGPENERILPAAHRRYYGLVQQGLLDTLCRVDGARPGHYRIIVALGISQAGEIAQIQRVGTVGSADADQQMDAALRGVRFSEPPPAGFTQPVRILISPEVPGECLLVQGLTHTQGPVVCRDE